MDNKLVSISTILYIIFVFSILSCSNVKKNIEDETELTFEQDGTQFQNGDIIFHSSQSSQSKALQLATNSKYYHCGIIYIENGEQYVFEAINPVQKTNLNQWISRGEGGHFVVKRLKNANQMLTPDNLRKMKTEGERMAGKNYDLAFGWSDDKIYCSELVWKIYKRGLGIELGETKN